MNILHLESSPRGSRSSSRKVAQELIEKLKAAHPNHSVVFRDLNEPAIPHVSNDFAEATNYAVMKRRPLTSAERAAISLSNELVEELRVADIVVLGMPMYNWSIPSVTKAYIDQVARPAVTLGYGPQGVFGLLAPGKKLYIVSTRGGRGYDNDRKHVNFADPYLRTVFGFLGFKHIEIIAVENHIEGGDKLKASLESAQERIMGLVAGSTAAS